MFVATSLSARIFALFCLVLVSVEPALAGEVTLEDNSILVSFDTNSGALTRLEDKTTHWMIERRPELGVSFRLFAPLPKRRYNPVFGQKQRAAEVRKVSDHQVSFQWKNLLDENGGVLPITLSADVTLANGVLSFSATVVNDSSLTVETIDYPCFGDFNPPARDATMDARILGNGKVEDLLSDEIFPHFRNEKGYWGVTYPTKTLEAQQSLFCLLQAPHQGLYCEINSPSVPYRLQYTFELHPGVISTVNNLVPQQDQFSGFPVHLEFRFCHFIFARPHSTTTLVPVILRGYKGDWHEGVNLYKQWRAALSQ